MNLAIFASYNASVLEPILKSGYKVSLIASNNPNSNAMKKAKKYGIVSAIVDENIIQTLKYHDIDTILLAGYMKLIDKKLIQAFPNRIINTHPALLPKYGGKGMYGINVHKAVIQNKEKQSGVTAHFVNEEYDKGKIILQKSLDIKPTWDEYDLEKHIKILEKDVVLEVLKTLS